MIRLPTFNLNVNLWRYPAATVNPPTLQFMANLAMGERSFQPQQQTTSGFTAPCLFMQLLCPKGTDIRFPTPSSLGDAVEVPAGSGRYYLVAAVDDAGRGFANEYRLAVLAQVGYFTAIAYGNPCYAPFWPFPTP